MPTLADQIEDTRALLAKLERDAATATCAEVGHDWECLGGAHCGCDAEDYQDCSVPVHECKRCHGCDYGDNDDARKVREQCALTKG